MFPVFFHWTTITQIISLRKEIEEDKKSAKDKNATLDIKRQSASVTKTAEGTDLALRLGAGNTTTGTNVNACGYICNG